MIKNLLAAATFLAPLPLLAAPVPAERFTAVPALTPENAAQIKATCDAFLARAAEMRTALETGRDKPGAATFRAYDDLVMVLDAAGNDAGLLAEVAPDEARRDAARSCQAQVSDAGDALSLSRPIYDRLKAISAGALDAQGQYLLKRSLADFERSGVSLDKASRDKIGALKAQITALGIKFEANIANGRKTITADPSELAGLPTDYIAAHKPGADGKVTISTDYPDYTPVMSYAKSEPLRQRMLMAFLGRAYPENNSVLNDLIAKRDELAKLLGRPDYATLALENKMVDTPAKARSFLNEVSKAADASAHRDYDRLLARLKVDQPNATAVPAWSSSYLGQQIRKENYNLDPQAVRKYFAYNKVRDGILQLTRDLFGVEIKPWKTKTWDPSVEAYEMFDGGKLIGQFYFDTHPRAGKYNHANVVPIRMGIEGRVTPVAALVTNFPAGDHKTGLMEHRDVETFLHEYGHLLHVIFSGKQAWEQANMGSIEWDFIEAPSQMLENWVWDYDTLSRFAVDESGNKIPRDLVEKMNKSRYFLEAFSDRRQFGLANASLAYYSGPPEADLAAEFARASDQYSLIPTLAGTHTEASFGHLNGYSAFYYTYSWSKTISLDLFTRFDRDGLRNQATARDYRMKVLAAGGSKPAATLVQSFLGRPLSTDAYRARLGKGE